MDVVLRNKTVPGAADNMSGVAAAMVLVDRFLDDRPDGVELVFAFTGAEEAGTGGAWRLQQSHAAEWTPEDTVVIGVDTVCNGGLRWFREGEMKMMDLAPTIEGALRACVAAEERFADVRPFRIPVGGTDAMPFLAKGYRGVTIGCVDTEYGAPRHYHHPSDVAENTDAAAVLTAVDFTEALIRRIGCEESSTST